MPYTLIGGRAHRQARNCRVNRDPSRGLDQALRRDRAVIADVAAVARASSRRQPAGGLVAVHRNAGVIAERHIVHRRRQLVRRPIDAADRACKTAPDSPTAAPRTTSAAALARFADTRDAAVRAGPTVLEWLNRWLASRLSLRAETRRSYGEFTRNYLVLHLGGMLVSEVRTGDVQGMFVSVIRRHEQAGRPLSPPPLQRINATARAAFNAAVRAGLVEVNPVRGVELPPARAVRAVVWTTSGLRSRGGPVVVVWTASQTAQFLSFARRDCWYAVFHLIALRGLSRGEACGPGC